MNESNINPNTLTSQAEYPLGLSGKVKMLRDVKVSESRIRHKEGGRVGSFH
jgi:hypothetical protein